MVSQFCESLLACFSACVRAPQAEMCVYCVPASCTKGPFRMKETISCDPVLQCSIELAEPVLFQKGLHLGRHSSVSQEQEAILRGKLVLRIAKPIKLKSIRLDFTGSSGVERHRGTTDQLPMNISPFIDN